MWLPVLGSRVGDCDESDHALHRLRTSRNLPQELDLAITPVFTCEQRQFTAVAYACRTMKTRPRALAVRNAAGNGEERAAQISHIQDRLDRLHRASKHITTEVQQLTDDVRELTHHEPKPLPPPTKESN